MSGHLFKFLDFNKKFLNLEKIQPYWRFSATNKAKKLNSRLNLYNLYSYRGGLGHPVCSTTQHVLSTKCRLAGTEFYEFELTTDAPVQIEFYRFKLFLNF